MIKLGSVKRILNNNIAELEIEGVITKARIVFPYGSYGKIPINQNTLALVFHINSSSQNLCCMPFNTTFQGDLSSGECNLKNQNTGAEILLASNGSIEITKDNTNITIDNTGNVNITTSQNLTINSNNTTITSSSTASITGTSINIGDAVGLTLNDNAIINDSLGNPCTITFAGQTKVSI